MKTSPLIGYYGNNPWTNIRKKITESHLILIVSIRALLPLRWNGELLWPPKIHFECHCGDFTIFISPFRPECHLFQAR